MTWNGNPTTGIWNNQMVWGSNYPAYQRYMFRWNFIDYNGGSNAFQLGEVAINEENGSQVLGATYVTANPSTGYGTAGTTSWQGPQRMVDGLTGNDYSKWCCGGGPSTTAYLVFDVNKPTRASSYSLYAGNDTNTFPQRRPHEVYLYGTNDLTVTSVTSDKWNLVSYSPQAHLSTANFGQDVKPCVTNDYLKNKKYQYFQWRFVTNQRTDVTASGQIQMEELTLIDRVSGELKGPNYLAAQRNRTGTLFGDGAIANLFDGNTATKYGAHTTFYTTGGVMFSAKIPVDVSGIGLQIGNDTNNSDLNKRRNPISWGLYACTSATTDWEDPNWECLYLSNSALPTTNYQWCYFPTYNKA